MPAGAFLMADTSARDSKGVVAQSGMVMQPLVAASVIDMQPHKCDCKDLQRLRSSSAKNLARLAFLALRAVANFAIVAIMPLA